MEHFNSEWPIITGLLAAFTIFLKVGLPNLKPIIEIIIEPFQKMATAVEKNADSLERVTKQLDHYETRCKAHQGRLGNKVDSLAINHNIDHSDPFVLDLKEEINTPPEN